MTSPAIGAYFMHLRRYLWKKVGGDCIGYILHHICGIQIIAKILLGSLAYHPTRCFIDCLAIVFL